MRPVLWTEAGGHSAPIRLNTAGKRAVADRHMAREGNGACRVCGCCICLQDHHVSSGSFLVPEVYAGP